VEAAKKFYGRNYVSDRTTTVLSCPMDAFPQSVYEVIFGAFGNVDVKPRKNSLDRFYFGFIYEDNRFVISVPVTGVDDITNMAYIQVDGVANAASNAEKLEQEAKVDHAGRVLSAWISGSGNWVFEKKNAD
jgi:hypothetical protein